MKNILSITEKERGRILRMHNLSEQTQPQKYMTKGSKFCMFGSCRVDIRVIDKTTGQIIISKSAEGEDITKLYSQVIKLIQDELTSKKISGVTLPTIDQLEDNS